MSHDWYREGRRHGRSGGPARDLFGKRCYVEYMRGYEEGTRNREQLERHLQAAHDTALSNLVEQQLLKLTPEQRTEVFGRFCRHCGAHDGSCQCWNDA